MRFSPAERGVSPVVGVVLLLVITLLLAGTVGAFALGIDADRDTADDIAAGELGTDEPPADGGTATPTPLQDDLVVAENDTAGASGVVHSTVIEVGSGVNGTLLEEILVQYPKDVDLELSAHDELLTIGIDTDADGELEATFDESDVSGVNTNDDDSELTVTFETGTTLDTGDRVVLRYEGANNPDSAGEYDVSVTLNEEQTLEGSLVVE